MREDGFGKRETLFCECAADDSTTDCKDNYGTVTDSKEEALKCSPRTERTAKQ